jgi:hypothetical protein
MTKQKDTLATTRARLDVIEAKLNELLKKFGLDEETLWDIHRHVYELALEQPKNHSESSGQNPDET